MNILYGLLIFLVGLVVGIIVMWPITKNRISQAQGKGKAEGESERATLIERISSRDKQIEVLNSAIIGKDAEIMRLQSEYTKLNSKVAELDTRIAEERKSAQDKLLLLNDAQTKLSDAFKALSAEALTRDISLLWISPKPLWKNIKRARKLISKHGKKRSAILLTR